MLKRLVGGIIGCKEDKEKLFVAFNGFPDDSNIGSTVYCTVTLIAMQGHQTKTKQKQNVLYVVHIIQYRPVIKKHGIIKKIGRRFLRIQETAQPRNLPQLLNPFGT